MNIAIPNWSAENDRLNGQISFVSLTQNIQPSHDVVAPAGIQVGDLLYYIDCCNEAGVGAASPTGFTADSSQSTGNHRLIISSKLADGTESGITLTGMGGANQTSATLLVFRVSPIAADANVFYAGSASMTDAKPSAVSVSQVDLSVPWNLFPASVTLAVFHSSPTLAWTDPSGTGGPFFSPVTITPYDSANDALAAPAVHGDHADITNSGTSFTLLLSYYTLNAGLESAIIGNSALATMNDIGDANAMVLMMYVPTIPGA